MSGDLIRVLLADDHAVVRAGLRAVLGFAKDIEVVGEARTGREAVTLTQTLSPDVVIMDLDMPDLDGAAALAEIIKLNAAARVLILTMHAEAERLVALIKVGAAGYLVKSAADQELVDAVRAVARGGIYLRPSASGLLASDLAKRDVNKVERDRFNQLSTRERDVLQLVSQGFSAPEIGQRLFISPKTVDTYKQRIQEKLGLMHRSDYVQMALRLGLLNAVEG